MKEIYKNKLKIKENHVDDFPDINIKCEKDENNNNEISIDELDRFLEWVKLAKKSGAQSVQACIYVPEFEYGSGNINISFQCFKYREETDEEYYKRKEQEKIKEELNEKIREETFMKEKLWEEKRERMIYERLKKKFDP